ncbi:hypothetical protein [Lentzea jiangxiensis]|uniref:Uncharacterized protein n=1 Tax=Lentzea jiangxiensis TaxID=641025 RepID=A0A1H0LVJ7_9PSEU|nr:hypothetical protein [Lentzea jiangxiensis]SDO72081.1 hypothetical protein SAMN05421507_103467 [Lentzea jiangxiensis]
MRGGLRRRGRVHGGISPEQRKAERRVKPLQSGPALFTGTGFTTLLDVFVSSVTADPRAPRLNYVEAVGMTAEIE